MVSANVLNSVRNQLQSKINQARAIQKKAQAAASSSKKSSSSSGSSRKKSSSSNKSASIIQDKIQSQIDFARSIQQKAQEAADASSKKVNSTQWVGPMQPTNQPTPSNTIIDRLPPNVQNIIHQQQNQTPTQPTQPFVGPVYQPPQYEQEQKNKERFDKISSLFPAQTQARMQTLYDTVATNRDVNEHMKAQGDQGITTDVWQNLADANRIQQTNLQKVLASDAQEWFLGDDTEPIQREDLINMLESNQSTITVGDKVYNPANTSYSQFASDYSQSLKNQINQNVTSTQEMQDVYGILPSETYNEIIYDYQMGDATQEQTQNRLNTALTKALATATPEQQDRFGQATIRFGPEGERSFEQEQELNPALEGFIYNPNKVGTKEGPWSYDMDYVKGEREHLQELWDVDPIWGPVGVAAKSIVNVGTQFPKIIYEGAGAGYRAATGQLKEDEWGDFNQNMFEGMYNIGQAARQGHETGDWLSYVNKVGGLESPLTTDILIPVATGGLVSGVTPLITGAATRAGIGTGAKLAWEGLSKGTQTGLKALGYGLLTTPITLPVAYTGWQESQGLVDPGTTASSLARAGIQLGSGYEGFRTGSNYLAKPSSLNKYNPETGQWVTKADRLSNAGGKLTEKLGSGLSKIKSSINTNLPKTSNLLRSVGDKIDDFTTTARYSKMYDRMTNPSPDGYYPRDYTNYNPSISNVPKADPFTPRYFNPADVVDYTAMSHIDRMMAMADDATGINKLSSYERSHLPSQNAARARDSLNNMKTNIQKTLTERGIPVKQTEIQVEFNNPADPSIARIAIRSNGRYDVVGELKVTNMKNIIEGNTKRVEYETELFKFDRTPSMSMGNKGVSNYDIPGDELLLQPSGNLPGQKYGYDIRPSGWQRGKLWYEQVPGSEVTYGPDISKMGMDNPYIQGQYSRGNFGGDIRNVGLHNPNRFTRLGGSAETWDSGANLFSDIHGASTPFKSTFGQYTDDIFRYKSITPTGPESYFAGRVNTIKEPLTFLDDSTDLYRLGNTLGGSGDDIISGSLPKISNVKSLSSIPMDASDDFLTMARKFNNLDDLSGSLGKTSSGTSTPSGTGSQALQYADDVANLPLTEAQAQNYVRHQLSGPLGQQAQALQQYTPTTRYATQNINQLDDAIYNTLGGSGQIGRTVPISSSYNLNTPIPISVYQTPSLSYKVAPLISTGLMNLSNLSKKNAVIQANSEIYKQTPINANIQKSIPETIYSVVPAQIQDTLPDTVTKTIPVSVTPPVTPTINTPIIPFVPSTTDYPPGSIPPSIPEEGAPPYVPPYIPGGGPSQSMVGGGGYGNWVQWRNIHKTHAMPNLWAGIIARKKASKQGPYFSLV